MHYPPEVMRGEYWGLGVFLLQYSLLDTLIHTLISHIYYPPEVRRGKYQVLGVLLLQYFPLVSIQKIL